MTRSTLRYWMWGYQEHFRKGVQSLARKVLAEIAAPCEAEVLLVGVRAPEASREDPVCIDPEFGPVPIETFESLETVVEAAIPHHPMQEIFYGDAARMADKPRIIRAKVIIDQVRARLAPHDDEQDVVSFVGFPQRVNDYLVAVVLRVPKVAFERHPELVLADVYGEKHDVGFFRACVSQLLATASERLQRPDPGRALGEDLLSPEEIARRGASSFLRAVSAQICDYHGGTDLFERLNDISALRYEGNGGVGRLVFMKPKVDTADFLFKLDEPVGLKEARWCRKILEMASGDAAMIATVREVLGVGRISHGSLDNLALSVDFHGHYDWEIRSGEQLLLRTQFGRPQLPHEALAPERFSDNVRRLFKESDCVDVDRLWSLFVLQSRRASGSQLIVAEDAETEAARLRHQATPIAPTQLTPEAFEHACRIDGGILVDPNGICFAIGVVLDGPARDECTPARGARFNSAVRYVLNSQAARMAIVVSDDRTVDVVPLLLPRVPRALIDKNIEELERSTREDFHSSRLFLDNHRFYLDSEQCDRVNAAIAKIEASPQEGTTIYFSVAPFIPDSRLSADYLS